MLDDHADTAHELSKQLEDHIKRFLPLTDGSFQSTDEAGEKLTFDALPRLDSYV